MARADEEARAAEYRAQRKRRVAAEAARRRALAGNPDRAAAVRQGFLPVEQALLERRAAGGPAEGC